MLKKTAQSVNCADFNQVGSVGYHGVDVEVPQNNAFLTPNSDDVTLVSGCRSGDRGSLERFFRAQAPYVERVVTRLVGPTADLQDLVQTTFIEAIQSFGRYRGEASLKTWVTRIAVHVCMHHLRAGVRRPVPLELVPVSHEPEDPAPRADGALSMRQLARRLYDLMDALSPKKRVAFILYVVEDYSLEEVAALTGASRAATKSRIWFARRELLAAVRNRPDLRAFIQSLGGAESWR
jgi:RNA polymerase sigma-70 factor (ECF subfamily)